MKTALLVCAILTETACVPAQVTHWAFKSPVRPAVPAVRNSNPKPQNPIDSFILAGLRQKGLSLSAPADRHTLIRRVTFDLTGLPPTPEETAAFLADRSPNAYEKVVQRLLKSPHFGERWAQHWLDVVRFAESNGYEHDLDRDQAWRYRDWVVAALNADMPYEQFLRMQVAGDLLKPGDFDARVATGFLRAGPFHLTGGNLDPDEMRQEWLTEATNGLGNAVLGMTVGCARCHDHKFDPLPQADYYRLQAFFAATSNRDQSRASEQEKKLYEEQVRSCKERQKPIESQVAAIEKPYREKIKSEKMDHLAPEYKAALAVEPSKRTPEQRKLAGEAGTQLNISWDEVVNALSPEDRARRAALRQKIYEIEREMPSPLPEAEGVGEALQPAPRTHILVRGEVHHPGVEVEPAAPGCLGQISSDVAHLRDRIALANWLTSRENPLTARVIVNRLWHYLFGRGLVATPNDFGKKGLLPTHPELLDWLAVELMDPTVNDRRPTTDGQIQNPKSGIQNGPWSLKRMTYLLVTSNAYRQASTADPRKAAIDPDNKLVWRMNRRRLDAEAVRDSVLATSGTLNREIGGPSVHVPLEPEVYDTIFTESEPDNLWPTTQDYRQHTRRSLYLFRKRNVRLPMLAVFDQPDMMTSCAARGQTVHALQALTLVNSEFMRKQSYALARRLFKEVASDGSKRINRLFALCLGRQPTTAELKATASFLAEQKKLVSSRPQEAPPAGVDASAFKATADLCLATLNLNEFIYIR